jgi:hypothetical protein
MAGRRIRVDKAGERPPRNNDDSYGSRSGGGDRRGEYRPRGSYRGGSSRDDDYSRSDSRSKPYSGKIVDIVTVSHFLRRT